MKTLSAFLILVSSFALAQNPPASSDAKALDLVRTAANIAANTQQQSMANYLAVYVDEQKWAALAKADADIGPFLKLEEPKAGRVMVLLAPGMSPTGVRVAVFFDNGTPAGIATSPNRTDIGKVKPIPKDALAAGKNNDKLEFQKTDGVNSDDGQVLEAWLVRSSE